MPCRKLRLHASLGLGLLLLFLFLLRGRRLALQSQRSRFCVFASFSLAFVFFRRERGAFVKLAELVRLFALRSTVSGCIDIVFELRHGAFDLCLAPLLGAAARHSLEVAVGCRAPRQSTASFDTKQVAKRILGEIFG